MTTADKFCTRCALDSINTKKFWTHEEDTANDIEFDKVLLRMIEKIGRDPQPNVMKFRCPQCNALYEFVKT